MKEITDYIDVYNAVYNAVPDVPDKRKAKIAEIADGLGVPPWEVAETLKAAGCSVNLQWFNQLKRKALQALLEKSPYQLEPGCDPDARAAEAAAAVAPADVSYLRKIIVRQDAQLKEDAEKYKAVEARAKDLACQLHEKDGELAAQDAKIRELNAELVRLGEEKEQLEIYVNEADNDNIKLHEILDQYEAELDKPAERHFFGIEGGEAETPLSGQMAQEDADATFDRCLAEMLDGLEGRSAYLCGRLLEALWCWKYEGDRKTISLSRLLLRELSFALQEGDA